ncbi:MAG: TetR/AcrR family transcriptional regulator [Anaerolineae bacterium]
MTESPSKRELQREERRSQILDAALTVFSSKGFHATNVSDVAAQAGVSQGTIYWYFDSKDDLLLAALLSFFDNFGEDMLSALDESLTADDKLRALGQIMVSFAAMGEGLFALFMEYWGSSDRREDAARMWADLLTEYKDVVVGIIQAGVQSGEFRPVDADALVWALMAAYDGLAAYMVLVPGLDVEAISGTFVETLLEGLVKHE